MSSVQRQPWFVGLVMFTAAVGAMWWFSPASAQHHSGAGQADVASQIGRYDLEESVGRQRVIFVLDTATGQLWSRDYAQKRWMDEGNPVTNTPPSR